MKQGDVILTSVPQADGKLKNRPAIILREMPAYGDLFVCGVNNYNNILKILMNLFLLLTKISKQAVYYQNL